VAADVSSADSVAALFAATAAAFGRLDILFANAGTSSRGVPFDEISVEDWRRVVDVNLTGTFLCAREAWKMMKRQEPRGGRIIVNGSLSAHVPRPHSAPYTSTKHALTGLTKALALDGRAFDICCGQIDVGNAETDMTARMARGVPQGDGTLRPEPTIDAAHVARAVLQMANLPLDTNIQSLTILASKMPFVGRG
jgi:NAD(P)-dependent dehydrogenase (short-subunit alcohol dehydrogenase family)